MKISIIIATFNSEATLSRCLNSVVNQSFKDFEILVKDGSSTDGTINILKSFQRHFAYYISSPDNGTYEAWNDCVYHATGDWLIFLGSDDYFCDVDSLSKVLPHLEDAEHGNCPLVHGENFIVRDGVVVGMAGKPPINLSVTLRSEMVLRHPGCFHNRLKMIAVTAYDSQFKIVGDYDLVYRLVMKYGNTIYYPFSIIYHSMGGVSTNPSRMGLLIREIYLMRQKNNIRPYVLFNITLLKRFIVLLLMSLNLKFVVHAIFNIKSRFK